MDAKDLKTDSAVGARNDGSNKYGPGSITCDGNKPYQEVGSNSLGKVDIQASRPCAVIGPDRVVAPVAPDVYHKKPPDQWLHPDQPYRRPPDYPLKMTEFQSPTRNISPRQTFQENMQRIMVPPTYNSLKLNSDTALSDTNVPLPNNKLNLSTDAKYCEVPYNISPLTGEPKSYKNVDISVSVGNTTVNQSAPYLWSATSVQQSRPYGATEFYPYADYTGCGSVRTLPTSRPHRLLPEETSSPYPERYFADGNVRFKPYPTIKDGYPQQRYECMSNYSNSYHPPPYPPPRYELQKPVVPHMYSSYPQVPVKYIDNRMAEPTVDGFQRSNPPPNYSIAFHNQFIHPAYGPVPGNCVQNKMFSYPPDVSVKQNHVTKLAYENNKVYSDFDIRNKAYGIPEHYYGNEMIRAHSTKGQVMLSKHPLPNSAMGGHSYYRNPQFRNYDHNAQIKNPDYTLNMNSPIMRFTPHFSPNSSSMSPLESSNLHGTIHDENIYLGQKPVGNMRNVDLRRMKTDMYGRYSTGLHRNYVDHKAINSSKDKKNIDVRQFLQQWNDDDENHDTNNSKQENIQDSIEQHQTSQNNKNQDQLYVLGLVNVPSEELSKYEHIQKISKLPDNIKGYNSLELLNQFEEAIEISNLNSNASTSGKLCELQVPMKQLPVQRATIPPQPRPVSPLDVEAKISQSVIHKEVGCNFEIKPCSPKMLNVEVAAPVQTVLDERVIEKFANPHGIKSPISKSSNNLISFSVPKNEDNQANLLHTKNSSCKLTNQFNSVECIPTSKANYSLNDLEGNSGVCLASLPRLDNEIEFNFPEVNQQFIDANKPDSLITSTAFVDPKCDLDYQQSLESSTHLKEATLSTHFNAVVDPISYPKLSKYRKIKKIDNDSQNEVHFPVQAMRTDSVIIKNETAKESNPNTGYEKLLDNTSSSKYDEIRKPASSQTVLTESDRYEEKDKLIESLLEKQESSNDIIIDFSVNKNNCSLSNSSNETNNHDFDVGICDQRSAHKSSDISGHKTLDILISDIYNHHAPDKLYNDVMEPVNSNNDDNELNPLVTEDISETNTVLAKPIKPEVEENYDNETVNKNDTDISSKCEISEFLINKQISVSESMENSESTCCLKEQDEDEKDSHIQQCFNEEVEEVKIVDEHANNTLSKINSIDDHKIFLKSDITPASIILDNPKTLNWSRKETRLEDVKMNIDPFGILINSKEPLNYRGESMNVDVVPLRTCAVLKVDSKEIYKVDQHCNETKFKDHSCENEDPNKEHTVFNIPENSLEEIGECNGNTNTVKEFNKDCSLRSVAEDNRAEIGLPYSALDSNNADLSKCANNHAIFENSGVEKIGLANSNANVIAIKDNKYGIIETVVKASGNASISNSNTNGTTTNENNTVIKDDIVKNACNEIGEPHSNMNLNVLQLSPSCSNKVKTENTIKDVICVFNNNTNGNFTNNINNDCNQDHDYDNIIVSASDKNIHATAFSKFDGNKLVGENICEEIGVFKCDTNLDATDLHINKCSKAEFTSKEICVFDSDKTLAQKIGKHCDSLENKQGVEFNHSLINKNTPMPISTKIQELTQKEYAHKSFDESIFVKTNINKVYDNILCKDSNEESVSKLTLQLHNDSFESSKDQLADVTRFDNAMPLVKNCSQNELRHENSCLEGKSITVDNSQDTAPSKINKDHNMVQEIYQYRKICYNSVPIKQFSPSIQKLMLYHEGITSLPIITCHSNQNNEMENICETISNKSPSTFSLNNIDQNIETENENSEKYRTSAHVMHEKHKFLHASVLTLKDIASHVLQTRCDINTTEKNCCVDYDTKISHENSLSNNHLSSKELVGTKYTTKATSSLKRSLSDSALNIFDDRSVTADHLWPKRKKPAKESIQTNLLAENYCRLLQNHRRNSIATIFNEDISFCILLDDNCIITEEGDDMTRNDLEEAISDSDHEELFKDDLKIMEKVNQGENDEVDLEIEEKPAEDCWIEDVACMETVVSDNIEESEEGVDYTEEENYDNIVSSPNHDVISKLEHNKVSAINLTDTVKNVNEVRYEMESPDNPLFKASQMDFSNLLSKEDADRQTLENILTGTDSVKIITNGYDVLKTSTHPCLENNKETNFFFDTDKEFNEKSEMDSLQQTQYDIIHSCESSIDNVFSYQDKEDITRYSTSPEVSSTTSEDKCSSILLKITNYKGSIISELSNSNDTKRISCKYTENNDYNKSNTKKYSNRPLITKAAQKYIPPLSESIPDLKVKLPLPPQSLLKFKDLKMAKEFPKIDSKLHKRSNIEPNLPKKIKPKFEDVLKSIDEIQIKMHKEKSKRVKKCIPKVVIKKSENGSHYTSSQNNELSDPDLTGRKWQPWVFIERSTLIDKMASKNKTKAIFSHRKNEFVLQDSFRKYKSVSSAKFVITQPRVEKLSKGQLKYTIKLKHS